MNDTANDHLREARRAQRLGPDPACRICGTTDPRILEAHHIAGRRNAPLTDILCRNHHTAITDDLRVMGVPMSDPSQSSVPELTRLAALLGGLAAFLRMVADSLAGWAEYLHRLSALGGDQ